jgi:hypothetical protein
MQKYKYIKKETKVVRRGKNPTTISFLNYVMFVLQKIKMHLDFTSSG